METVKDCLVRSVREMMSSTRGRVMVSFLSVLFVFALVGAAHAVTAPGSGSFAYSVYDVAVNKMLKGPVGFVAGVGAIVYGAITAMRGHLVGALPILAGAVLLKADSIVSSLGLLIR